MASTIEVTFAHHRFVLDADLALWWPSERVLVVSDLHLEKSTFLAQFGSAIAPYDTHDTLLRLESLIRKYSPQTLILLGDSFHDRGAWQRLEAATRDHLLGLCNGVGSCLWVEGNHDVGLVRDDRLTFIDEAVIDGIAFRHEPVPSGGPQIIGHFHPKLGVHVRGHRLSGKCFAVNAHMMILPAFGSFTGGLNLDHGAFTALAGDLPFTPYLVYQGTITRRPPIHS
ncbi:ligase-associated DNA damage response endonuclease PdeM [Asticcacaulis sp. YBE204]|uniref:ligase-associated DNA damage response endonuclease PdeM n=1 Tax=Asticcacaulis sp. YBE204 TaxID=1282363 RepID=UPI0003C40282|nr:ligase-associated DNA damage response endonuclease PdeM [Asticcacaulis sp. YBE204]ESQ79001.1 hypothetical protein AEYBE204_11295 [Asticcacaulis sp. YBE204]